ncbi:MAG TPA: hypothetical protein P5340_01565 [Defluviicoccus sp.]|nr:hypothetical protein [Defluviicoccus sp.]
MRIAHRFADDAKHQRLQGFFALQHMLGTGPPCLLDKAIVDCVRDDDDRRPCRVLAQGCYPLQQSAIVIAHSFGDDYIHLSCIKDRKGVIKAGRCHDLQFTIGMAYQWADEGGFSPVVRSNQQYGGSLHVR